MAGWHVGNAERDGTDGRGWILGHFFPGEDDIRASGDVEVKWGTHSAGDQRSEWVTSERRTTLLLLIKGHFHVNLSVGNVELKDEGDYVIWGPGIDHTWRAEDDTVVLTVRWPSII